MSAATRFSHPNELEAPGPLGATASGALMGRMPEREATLSPARLGEQP